LTRRSVDKYATEFRLAFPLLFDATGELAKWLKPTRLPEAFVVDRAGQVLYRGRIDDQWAGIGQRRAQATTHELQAVLAAVSAGQPVGTSTTPTGCVFEGHPKPDAPITYTRHVAPILQNNCQACHRPGEVAPFPLTNYVEAARHAEMIREVTSSRRMPPWKAADAGLAFHGQRGLSSHEITTLAAWADGGAPEGDPADLPEPPVFPDGWQLGTPDLIVTMNEPYAVPASGDDILRYFVLPIPLDQDQMVTAVEFRPGNRRVCHHAIMYLDSSGAARRLDAQDAEPGYPGFGTPGFRPTGLLGFWAPGYSPKFLPAGVGRRLPHRSLDLVMQLHYHPSGKPESDQSTVGLYFAKQPTTHDDTAFVMGTLLVDIPPGDAAHRLTSSVTLPAAVQVTGITPHMHLIGKQMKVTATLPDGTQQTLLWVNDWDFNWQEQYHYVAPHSLPQGTRLDLEAIYDNSADNPANPNTPPARMALGEQSTDEMCFCVIHTITPHGAADDRLVQRAAGQNFLKELGPELLAKLGPERAQMVMRTLIGGGGASPVKARSQDAAEPGN
jgi:mono/diheme cytochrome c family protein